MINMRRIVHSREWQQSFTVIRSTGDFVDGRWVEDTPTEIEVRGAIIPMNAIELQQVPEADRVRGGVKFYTTIQLNVTRGETDTQVAGTSDRIKWHGDYYRLFSVNDYADYGFYVSSGERVTGN